MFDRPRRRPHRTLLLVTLVASALAGCSIGNGPEGLRRFERPAGATLPEATWTVAGENAGKTAFEADFWLVPTWLAGESTEAGVDGSTLRSSEFSFLDLGVILPVLPLWIGNETRLYERSGRCAISTAYWTPLATGWETSDWPADEPTFRASGFPLLFSRLDYGTLGAAPQLELNTTLWTFGPSWGRADIEQDDGRARGWFCSPLLLIGLGPYLWTSAEIETPREDLTAHGPLHGWLGYRRAVDHEDDESTRRIVAGLLWYDVEECTVAGEVVDARHGPLWGMFGWGVSHGNPGLRVFWFPIDV